MPLACHLDADLKERLFQLLHRPSRQPSDWTVPIRPCDLKRLMGAAGIEPVGGFFDGEVYRPEDELGPIRKKFSQTSNVEAVLLESFFPEPCESLTGQPYGPEGRVIPPHPEKPL